MKLIYEVVSIAGKVRSENQDNFYLNGKIKRMTEAECRLSSTSDAGSQVFAVCDGMGGEDSGEIAAAMAVEILQKYTSKQSGINWADYLKEANTKLCSYQEEYCVSMGTTFAGICISQDGLTAVNVGDSRIYQIHEGRIRQLSRDHNEYQTILDAGIKADEHVLRRAKSRLIQFLGLPDNEMRLEPHVVNIPEIVPGDYYFICSDGLYGVLSDAQIVRIIKNHKIEDGGVCETLVKEAEKQGSKDNITGLLIFIADNTRTMDQAEFLKKDHWVACAEYPEKRGSKMSVKYDEEDTLEIPIKGSRKIPGESFVEMLEQSHINPVENNIEDTESANPFAKLKRFIQKHF